VGANPRDGIRASLIDEQRAEAIPLKQHLDAVLASIAEDAEVLGCKAEIEETRQIATRGGSADRQLETFAECRGRSQSMNEAAARRGLACRRNGTQGTR